jgi:signal transduction histidine kinase
MRTRWVTTIGAGIAVMFALAITTQTYLSMLGHGHSFGRILAWQLSAWSFWALVAPLVLRRGAEAAERTRTASRFAVRVVLPGAALIALHAALTSQLAVWFQPFVPVETYDFSGALRSQLPAFFAIDVLAYGLLVVAGGAIAVRQRAQQLELRESRLEAELTRAQLHALRLEIEPHFLFNTLNAIAALIRLKDNSRALDMLVGLSDFMRSNLDHSRDQFAPLSNEIEWVRRYVTLQQTRFADRLDVSYDIDADCLNVRVPTLVLQPIVENALRHGVGRQPKRCRIVVGARREDRRLTLRVVDDGAGLPAGFDISRDAGTGLSNTRSRLAHIYGNGASLDIRRGERGGTSVAITVPVEDGPAAQRATA